MWIWRRMECVKWTDKTRNEKNNAETDQEEKKKLAVSLAEKKLTSEGCTGRNGEREKSSGQKKISDDGRQLQTVHLHPLQIDIYSFMAARCRLALNEAVTELLSSLSKRM
ncbi:hypothetical protein ANN_25632 [Periplaneta americana]|uniref:Uncharacterized protein n=1 Tax=Periplaneta americana TaxID=6978 RepID=A0ABQ8S1I0_PERAM|nr:hypothetical protein ANN_25632 [Periplaneta americana]